jgi:hypothetical protein
MNQTISGLGRVQLSSSPAKVRIVGTNNILTVGLTRDFQTVGYVHVGSEIFIRAYAH